MDVNGANPKAAPKNVKRVRPLMTAVRSGFTLMSSESWLTGATGSTRAHVYPLPGGSPARRRLRPVVQAARAAHISTSTKVTTDAKTLFCAVGTHRQSGKGDPGTDASTIEQQQYFCLYVTGQQYVGQSEGTSRAPSR
jgi:hypothetical protein